MRCFRLFSYFKAQIEFKNIATDRQRISQNHGNTSTRASTFIGSKEKNVFPLLEKLGSKEIVFILFVYDDLLALECRNNFVVYINLWWQY